MIQLSRLLRYYSIVSTTAAGSGHPTSCMSAADLIAGLIPFIRYDVKDPDNEDNDKLIFSKGHAVPLLYSLFTALGAITEKKLFTLRRFESCLEGHPTMRFKHTFAPTGSLGQGLSIGVGAALNAKIECKDYKTYVLLGDSEMAEGSVWEALAIASHYKLNNLIGIIDVNRLGQRGETIHGHHIKMYKRKIRAFGWNTITINGHNHKQIRRAYESAQKSKKPVMIIAKTIKGKGFSGIENKEGFHGKTLSDEQMQAALKELGPINKTTYHVQKPLSKRRRKPLGKEIKPPVYEKAAATRKAYGNALRRIFPKFPKMVVLDAEVSNSTYAKTFADRFPKNFFEMFIAEQNMVGTALGLSLTGKKPFVSTFAAFLTRAYDQIRMCQYADTDIVFCGSHCGVSIGADGFSQMGLEDISMFRTIQNSTILYPCDAYSTERLVQTAAKRKGITYIRTTRSDTPLIYDKKEKFVLGKLKVLKKSRKDRATVIAAGITVHEALKAYEKLKEKGIFIRVIDLYCVKPLPIKQLRDEAKGRIITVEDHYPQGGIGEAVSTVLNDVKMLAVRKMPKSGKLYELLRYEQIDAKAIIEAVKSKRLA